MLRMPVPDNEFTEHATADMPSADKTLYYLFNPDKCDFPDAARRQALNWKRSMHEHLQRIKR